MNVKSYYPIIRNKQNFLLDLLMIILCGIALYHGIKTTIDLKWALGNFDFSRDVSNAQAIIDGEFPNDPVYKGETMWYNPLVPLIIGGLSFVFRLPINIIYVRAGAYLNILVPITFYILSTTIFRDRKVGLAATLGFLFLGTAPKIDPWIHATYTPWFLPMNFVQSIFYISFAALIMAARTNSWKWYLVTGLLWGITFLGHTAPALLIGGLITFLIIKEFILNIFGRLPLSISTYLKLISSVILAALTSIPFWMPIYQHYHFRVLNFYPINWTSPILYISNVTVFLKSNISLMTMIAFIGIITLWNKHAQHDHAIQLAMIWGALATTGILFEFLRQLKELPTIVPGVHSLLYFRSFIAMGFGYGLNFLILNLSNILKSRNKLLVYLCILCFLLIFYLPSYSTRFEFTGLREIVKNAGQQKNDIDVINWIQNNTNSKDVFIASNSVGLRLVTPTGRKLVLVTKTFSNPYVDWKKREQDNNLMFKYLKNYNSKNITLFKKLTSFYDVSYILISNDETKIDETYPFVYLFSNEDYKIYKLP